MFCLRFSSISVMPALSASNSILNLWSSWSSLRKYRSTRSYNWLAWLTFSSVNSWQCTIMSVCNNENYTNTYILKLENEEFYINYSTCIVQNFVVIFSNGCIFSITLSKLLLLSLLKEGFDTLVQLVRSIYKKIQR